MSEEINDNQNMPDNDSAQTQSVYDNQNIPDDDSTNPYKTIIEQQQAQINALIAQTTALNNQIVNMVTSGAQLNDNKPVQSAQSAQPAQPPALSDDVDYSLESLAKEIGRKS